MEEYYERHWPGNPQKALLVSLPKPVDNRRIERRNAAIVFLRFRSKLPYRMIAKVVGESYGSVRRVCKRVLEYGLYQEFNGRRRPKSILKKNLESYRKRYRMFLRGEINKLDEAFKFGGK